MLFPRENWLDLSADKLEGIEIKIFLLKVLGTRPLSAETRSSFSRWTLLPISSDPSPVLCGPAYPQNLSTRDPKQPP